MVISLKNSTYPNINVLELTPEQLADNEARAVALAERIVTFADALPKAINEIIPPPAPTETVDAIALDRPVEAIGYATLVGQSNIGVTPLDKIKAYMRRFPNDETEQREARELLLDKLFGTKEENGDGVVTYKEADKNDVRVQAFEKLLDEKIDPFIKETLVETRGSRSDVVNKAFDNETDNKLPRVSIALNERFNIMSIEDAIAPDASLSFSQAVDQEITRREFFLNIITEIMAERGIALDAKKMATDYSHITRRVMSSEDLIIADHLPKEGTTFGSVIDEEKILAFAKESSAKQELSYRFAFLNFMVPEKDGDPQHRRTTAAYFIDPRILKELKEHSGEEKLDQRILQGFLTVARLADHDYFHGMTLPEQPNPQFIVPDSPAQKGNLEQAVGNVPLGPYEILSQHTQYEVMQRIYARQPQVKERILEQAVNYMEEVQALRDKMVAAHPERAEAATETAEFLTQMYAGRLFHIIGFNDPDLEKRIKTEHGNTSSIKEQMDAIYHTERPAVDIGAAAAAFTFNSKRILRSAAHDVAHADPASLSNHQLIVGVFGKAGLLLEKPLPPENEEQKSNLTEGEGSEKKAAIQKVQSKEYEPDPLEIKAGINLLHYLALSDAYSHERAKDHLDRACAKLLEPESSALLSEVEKQAVLRVAERIIQSKTPVIDMLKDTTLALVSAYDATSFPAVYNRKTVDMVLGEAEITEPTSKQFVETVQKAFQQTFTFENANEPHPTINPVRGFNAFRQRYNEQTQQMLEITQNYEELPKGTDIGTIHYTSALQELNLALKSRADLFETTPTRYQRDHTNGMVNSLASREANDTARTQLEYDYFLGKDGLLTRLDTDLHNPIIVNKIGSQSADNALLDLEHFRKTMGRIATGLEVGRLTVGEKNGQDVSLEGKTAVAALKERLAHEAEKIATIAEGINGGIAAAQFNDGSYPNYNMDEVTGKIQALSSAASGIAAQQKKPSRSM
jgi:hypothetical protein